MQTIFTSLHSTKTRVWSPKDQAPMFVSVGYDANELNIGGGCSD